MPHALLVVPGDRYFSTHRWVLTVVYSPLCTHRCVLTGWAPDGQNWRNITGWFVEGVPFCSWAGLSCNETTVTQLALPGNALSGTTPSELGMLTTLQLL